MKNQFDKKKRVLNMSYGISVGNQNLEDTFIKKQ